MLKISDPDRAEVLEIEACPSRMVLEMLADKWKLLVFHSLRQQSVMRNGELMRTISGISQKMLTQTLRSLERDGLILRKDYQEVPPRVEYSLTDLGQTLCEPIQLISDWGISNMGCVISARTNFDERESVTSD
ncbi:MAG: HxlR family transcriptional regulator [Ponticaulis sp.]|nr:HxlR family transcriptional regulator [Ponticaulis sp.]|tara:strand:+ start:2536 stop:2934 length:399 start_codon:yes stop_codon:yes gene_type:complete